MTIYRFSFTSCSCLTWPADIFVSSSIGVLPTLLVDSLSPFTLHTLFHRTSFLYFSLFYILLLSAKLPYIHHTPARAGRECSRSRKGRWWLASNQHPLRGFSTLTVAVRMRLQQTFGFGGGSGGDGGWTSRYCTGGNHRSLTRRSVESVGYRSRWCWVV